MSENLTPLYSWSGIERIEFELIFIKFILLQESMVFQMAPKMATNLSIVQMIPHLTQL